MAELSSHFSRAESVAELEQGLVLQPKFDADGLVVAVVTDAATRDVLMLAWMNADALTKTIETRTAHFWSRSRGRLWQKGEDSGNVLAVERMRIDCDQDAVLIEVRVAGRGVACHTGARSCFYREVVLDGRTDGQPRLRRCV